MSDQPAESASQETIWDLEIDPITGLTTNADFCIFLKTVRNIQLLMEKPSRVVCSLYALLPFFYHILALGFILLEYS